MHTIHDNFRLLNTWRSYFITSHLIYILSININIYSYYKLCLFCIFIYFLLFITINHRLFGWPAVRVLFKDKITWMQISKKSIANCQFLPMNEVKKTLTNIGMAVVSLLKWIFFPHPIGHLRFMHPGWFYITAAIFAKKFYKSILFL